MREHLRAVEKATGQRPPELDIPPVPTALAQLWDVYLQLDAGRGEGGFGMAAIGWRDMAAWQSITGIPLTEWEAETLIRVDRVIRAELSKD